MDLLLEETILVWRPIIQTIKNLPISIHLHLLQQRMTFGLKSIEQTLMKEKRKSRLEETHVK